MQTFRRLTIMAAISLAGAACASTGAPAQHLADAEASIRAAEEVGAPSIPEAALQLKMAQDRVHRARALVADGENEDAARLLEEARLNGELAVLLARKHEAQASARDAQQRASTRP